MDRFIAQWRGTPLPSRADEEDDLADFIVPDEEVSDEEEEEEEEQIESESEGDECMKESKVPPPSSIRRSISLPPPAAAASTSKISRTVSKPTQPAQTAKQAFILNQHPLKRLKTKNGSIGTALPKPSTKTAAITPSQLAATRKRKPLNPDLDNDPNDQDSTPSASQIEDVPDSPVTAPVASARPGWIEIDSDIEEELNLKVAVPSSSSITRPTDHRKRNIVYIMQAVQSNTIPFAGQHQARLARKTAQLQNKARAEKESWNQTDPSAESSTSLTSDAPKPYSDNVYLNHRLLPESSSPDDISLPFYFSTPFPHRIQHVFTKELLHHSLNCLVWSKVKPVWDWSLCGCHEMMSIMDGRSNQSFMQQSAPPPLSYVSSIQFDSTATASLFSAVSSNGRLDLYDFENCWQGGRQIERTKRTRVRRARDEEARNMATLSQRPLSPPRQRPALTPAAREWREQQQATPAPSSRSSSNPLQPKRHEFLAPIFSVNIPQSGSPVPASFPFKSIDTHRWSPYNQNEIALSSQRSNQIVILDLTRCDENGSPHRRLTLSDSTGPLHQQCVMDFTYFPATSTTHGSTHTLVAALRGGEVNVLDLRVDNKNSSTDFKSTSLQPKLYKSQQRLTASSSRLLNSPSSLQVSNCGTRLNVFTESGVLECWDTRLMRAKIESVQLMDQMWNASNPTSQTTSSSPTDHPHSNVRHLGLDHRNSSAAAHRICSTSIHPQDDQCFLFQMYNGSIGLLDLNPVSQSFKRIDCIVPVHPDFLSTLSEEFALKTRRGHVFLMNGQVGTSGSARREKNMVVCNSNNDIEFWGQSTTFSQSSESVDDLWPDTQLVCFLCCCCV